MTDIGFIGNNRPETNHLAPSRPADMVQDVSKSSAESQETVAPRGDKIEISDHARHLAAIKRLPDTRVDKVDAAREAIADGVLNSEEMLEKALEIMISESKYL
jgi:anti-sigma28 factor (negative regulator of flagellin synthesis)